jgi:hypothetical protein
MNALAPASIEVSPGAAMASAVAERSPADRLSRGGSSLRSNRFSTVPPAEITNQTITTGAIHKLSLRALIISDIITAADQTVITHRIGA